MSIKIMKSSELGYTTRAERIVELYNQASQCPFNESLNLVKPCSTRIIFSEGDSAGVLVDNHPSHNVWRVMFAAFDSPNRERGLLRECITYAKAQGIDIALVEINGGDEASVWERLGYTHFGSIGMCMTLSNRSLDFIDYSAVLA